MNRRRPYFFLPQMWIVRPPPGGVFHEPTRLLPNLKVRPVLVRLPILLKMPIFLLRIQIRANGSSASE